MCPVSWTQDGPYQQLEQLFVGAVVHGPHERVAAVRVEGVDVGADAQQVRRRVQAVVLHAHRLIPTVRTGGSGRYGCGLGPYLGSEVQGGEALTVARGHVGAGLDQQAAHGEVARADRPEQRGRGEIAADGVHVRAMLDEPLCNQHVVVDGRPVQGRDIVCGPENTMQGI